MSVTQILGKSEAIASILSMIDKIAPTTTNILILGESGTGKELVARRIHDLSKASKGTFVAINCGAIPENLMESELFGHMKGSFTGAVVDKPGLFETASDGTLFLDEIGELPLSLQVKLLRALQDKTIRRVGGNKDIKVNVRIVSATNRDLAADVKKGVFREDLYYRLNVLSLKLPPLRDRGEDLWLLFQHFFKLYCERQNKSVPKIHEDAKEAIFSHPWPGNVRELQNQTERLVSLLSDQEINKSTVFDLMNFSGKRKSSPSKSEFPMDLPPLDFSKGEIKLDDLLKQIEKAYVDAASKVAGDSKKAKKLLGRG